MKEVFWSDFSREQKDLIVRELNDTFNFACVYSDANSAASAVRVGFEMDPFWFNFGISNLDAFEIDIEYYINNLYFDNE